MTRSMGHKGNTRGEAARRDAAVDPHSAIQAETWVAMIGLGTQFSDLSPALYLGLERGTERRQVCNSTRWR